MPGSGTNGTQSSAPWGHANPGGITPITVWAVPFSETVRPIASRALPKRRCQSPCDRTTVRGSPLPSGLNVPPSCGATPSVVNRVAVTAAPASRSGSSTPVRL